MVNFGNQVIAQKLVKRDNDEDDEIVSITDPKSCATHCYGFDCPDPYCDGINDLQLHNLQPKYVGIDKEVFPSVAYYYGRAPSSNLILLPSFETSDDVENPAPKLAPKLTPKNLQILPILDQIKSSKQNEGENVIQKFVQLNRLNAKNKSTHGQRAVDVNQEGATIFDYNVKYADKKSGSWDPQIVEQNKPTGLYTSCAVVDGQPAIAYYDMESGALKYARFNGLVWEIQIVDDGGNGGDDIVGWFLSLAIIDGQPAIAYLDVENEELKYVEFDGSSWGVPEVVDTITLFFALDLTYLSISLAQIDGKPAISYNDAISDPERCVLKYAVKNGGWSTQTVDDGSTTSSDNTGFGSSLIEIDGKSAISYVDVDNSQLMYATLNGSWNIEVVTPSLNSSFTSLALIGSKPTIAYSSSDQPPEISVAQLEGGSWTTESTGSEGFSPSLKEINGNPAISFTIITGNPVTLGLGYTALKNGSWETVVVDTLNTISGTGFYSSLVQLDSKPVISYWDLSNFSLRFARQDESNSWLTTTVDNSGSFGQILLSLQEDFESLFQFIFRTNKVSLAKINKQPAVAYTDTNFNFSTVSNVGLDFGSAVRYNKIGDDKIQIVDSTGINVGVSLADVNGYPAISYIKLIGDFAHVMYAHFDGSEWIIQRLYSFELPVSSLFLALLGFLIGTSLTIINGQPAIAATGPFFTVETEPEQGSVELLFFQFDGISWPNQPQIAAMVDFDLESQIYFGFPSLAQINGQPAISYAEISGNLGQTVLKYVSFNGSNWSTPQTVDDSGSYSSLVQIGSQPAIAYLDNFFSASNLKYALFDGTDWQIEEVQPDVDFACIQLAQIDGQPAISFSKDGIIKYVVRNGSWGSPEDIEDLDFEDDLFGFVICTTLTECNDGCLKLDTLTDAGESKINKEWPLISSKSNGSCVKSNECINLGVCGWTITFCLELDDNGRTVLENGDNLFILGINNKETDEQLLSVYLSGPFSLNIVTPFGTTTIDLDAAGFVSTEKLNYVIMFDPCLGCVSVVINNTPFICQSVLNYPQPFPGTKGVLNIGWEPLLANDPTFFPLSGCLDDLYFFKFTFSEDQALHFNEFGSVLLKKDVWYYSGSSGISSEIKTLRIPTCFGLCNDLCSEDIFKCNRICLAITEPDPNDGSKTAIIKKVIDVNSVAQFPGCIEIEEIPRSDCQNKYYSNICIDFQKLFCCPIKLEFYQSLQLIVLNAQQDSSSHKINNPFITGCKL